jgi:hypothetical protein
MCTENFVVFFRERQSQNLTDKICRLQFIIIFFHLQESVWISAAADIDCWLEKRIMQILCGAIRSSNVFETGFGYQYPKANSLYDKNELWASRL